MNLWNSTLTETGKNKIAVQGKDISWLIANHWSFSSVVGLMFSGVAPDPYQERILNAILVAFCDHGLNPPSTNATRFAASCGAELNASVIAGLSCLGEYHAPLEECAKMLTTAVKCCEPAESKVTRYRTAHKRIPGFGHPIHSEDPRVEPLLSIAVAGRHLHFAKQIEACLEKSCGRKIPLNAAGASAALLCDCGISPEYANAFFIIGRTVGLVAHAVEQSHDKKKVKVL